MAEKCAEYAGLQAEVKVVLEAIAPLTTEQLDAFEKREQRVDSCNSIKS